MLEKVLIRQLQGSLFHIPIMLYFFYFYSFTLTQQLQLHCSVESACNFKL